MSEADSVGKLESAALKRKAKLAELKAKRNKKDSKPQSETEDNKTENLPGPIFRSYQPEDEGLKDSILPQGKPAELTEQVREELIQEQSALEIQQLDFSNLAPRKPDWDLKRDIAPKLDKLERRTQRAIAELIRERLNKDLDLANAVSVQQGRFNDEDDE